MPHPKRSTHRLMELCPLPFAGKDFKRTGNFLTRPRSVFREDGPHCFKPASENFFMQTNPLPRAPAFQSFSHESININEDASVNYWTTALGCSEYELRIAVAEVGTGAKDVGTELGRAV